MAQFTATQLLNPEEFKVTGVDDAGVSGETKLVSPEWAEVLARRVHKEASEKFDSAMGKFFAPLEAELDEIARIAHPSTNQWSEYVLDEGVEGVPAVRVKLNTHGQYLRMIEETDGSKLSWLNGELVAVR